jgi:hypothetical protein
VLTGNDVMIGGFVIGGSSNKTVAIVASGPSLVAFGITDPLANPKLTLVRFIDQAVDRGPTTTGRPTRAPRNCRLRVSRPPTPGRPRSTSTWLPGAYTAIVEGADGGTGVSVVGVYEVDLPAVQLANISTRGRVGTGNDVMIGGFIINGSGPRTVAIVATGPSLVDFGIAGPLANPSITLVRSSDQAVIATNDDWQTDAQQSQLQAAGFAPSNPLESALYQDAPARGVHGHRPGSGRRDRSVPSSGSTPCRKSSSR